MSIEQIKEKIRELDPSELDQVAALILQIRRTNDPERKKELSQMIDDKDVIPWSGATED
ncbi:MAG: hypothetical protein O3C43_15320 [Verrucomicrobia bacterium]|nr:hypothetical protein [Verrucomicrobiota bacterium]MDA1067861.1 hypothetical protein [Verrucomicrobiota bacterium]